MKINYSNVYVGNYRELLSDEELNNLILLASKQRKFLDYKYRQMIDGTKYSMLIKKAFEFTNINRENNSRPDYEKNIIANNIVFSNSQCAKLLNIGKFDLKSLQAYIALIRIVKNNKENANQKYVDAVNAFTIKLMNHFRKYVGSAKPEIIINKINELLTYEPELIELAEKDNKRSR